MDTHGEAAVEPVAVAALAALLDENAQLRAEVASLRLHAQKRLADDVAQVTSPLTQHRTKVRVVDAGKRVKAESFCPCCRRPIDIEPASSLEAAPDRGPLRYAYVALLYGNSAASVGYVLGALALGHSLSSSGSRYDRVLMHTRDVPESLLHCLASSGLWQLHEVEYLHGCSMLGQMETWKGIFTKLRLFSLTDYTKVLFLDLDVLALKCLDELFELPAPAATLKGSWQPRHGDAIDGRAFFPVDNWNEPHGGINAGVMLLEPCARIHERMAAEVVDQWHPEHIYSYGPEQEYISRFFADRWTQIGVNYNFQMYRLSPRAAFLKLPASIACTDVSRDLHAAQWSSCPKPWAFVGMEDLELPLAVARVFDEHHGGNADAAAVEAALRLLRRWLGTFRVVEGTLLEAHRQALSTCAAAGVTAAT